MKILHANTLLALAILVPLLSASGICATVHSTAQPPVSMQLIPGSGVLTLSSTDSTATLRQSSTPVQLIATHGTISAMHPIYVYAYLTTKEAMRRANNGPTMDVSSLRIRNDHGEWAQLVPLPELEGRSGVRIAVVNGASATILLQVQLKIPDGQTAGEYQGILTLEAQEQ